jgi:hypothetical protein
MKRAARIKGMEEKERVRKERMERRKGARVPQEPQRRCAIYGAPMGAVPMPIVVGLSTPLRPSSKLGGVVALSAVPRVTGDVSAPMPPPSLTLATPQGRALKREATTKGKGPKAGQQASLELMARALR